jgi:signal peptidase I
MAGNRNSNKTVVREWVESIVIAALLAVFARSFLFQVYKIPTTSMVPTLVPHDKIFVSKLVYGPKIPFTDWRIPGFRFPQRGDVVVFIPPHEKNKIFFRQKPYIKRLVGLGGDHLLIKNGKLYINGKVLEQENIITKHYTNSGKYGTKEIVIPKDKYFVLGDNSANSYDSRYWGFVGQEDIIGKAIFIWWPLQRIGIIR